MATQVVVKVAHVWVVQLVERRSPKPKMKVRVLTCALELRLDVTVSITDFDSVRLGSNPGVVT